MLYKEAQLLCELMTPTLVIALGYKHFFNTLEIWLEAGVQGKNNLRFINVNSIY